MKFQRLASQPEAIVLQRDSFKRPLDPEPTTARQTLGARSRQSYPSALAAAVAHVWKSCLNALVGSSDPVITRMKEDGGDRASLYSIYDPVTKQRIKGLSEAEVRTWLDQRYYH
ncbi:MAG: hypothetical protein VKJ64_18975 [Leptolyngbyaceae bacterium]|nr:hypothetical protein [Leptolyngbyaceae bacterium]